MKIYNLAGILYIPLFIIGLAIWFFSDYEHDYKVWVIVPMILVTIIYLLSNEINQWWWGKNTPQLPQKMKDWLTQYSSYYNSLTKDKKAFFEQLMSLFIETNQFYIVGKEAEPVPYDIKGIVSHEAVKLMDLLGSNPLDKINRIVLYKHAFPSPAHQYLHTVECHKIDDVIIFSLEHLIPGLINNTRFYNIAMHGYIEMSKSVVIQDYLSSTHDYTWEDMTKISGLTENFIKSTVGLKDVNLATVALNFNIQYPEKFAAILPVESERIHRIWKNN